MRSSVPRPGVYCGLLLVGLLAAGCATHARAGAPPPATGSAVTATGAVPWLDAPTVPGPAPDPPSPLPRPADARPCGARDVHATSDGRNGAGGHEVMYLRFRNVSRSTCVLKGYPRVSATEAGLRTVIGTDGSFFPSGQTANIAPGQRADLGVETDTYCAARPGGGPPGALYHRLHIALPGGGHVAVDEPRGFDPTCGLHITAFSVPQAPQPEPRSVLSPSLETPATVFAGATLVYVVDLINPTDQPIALNPCPAYVQAIANLPTPVKEVDALNCGPVGAIGAHRTKRFQMRLTIPPSTPEGPITLHWDLIGVEPAAASATIGVVTTGHS